MKDSPAYGARRFHALYDKVSRSDALWRAYVAVRRNDGAPGIDKTTLAAVEEYGVTWLLDEVAAELEEGRYRPLPARRVFIPKPGAPAGEQRPLSIPLVREAALARLTAFLADLGLEPKAAKTRIVYGITVAPRAGKPWRGKPNAGGERRR